MCPLPALRLVAGDGIAVFHLQGIVVGVAPQGLETVGFHGQVGIILHHIVVELLLQFTGQGRRLGGEGGEQGGGRQLQVVVVGQLDGDFGEAEAVKLVHAAHALHHAEVAIGQERHRRRRPGLAVHMLFPVFHIQPEVVVLHNHQPVATTQLLLAVEHLVADALVVDVGTLVRTGDDHRLVEPRAAIAAGQRFYQLAARHVDDVGKALEAYFRKR